MYLLLAFSYLSKPVNIAVRRAYAMRISTLENSCALSGTLRMRASRAELGIRFTVTVRPHVNFGPHINGIRFTVTVGPHVNFGPHINPTPFANTFLTYTYQWEKVILIPREQWTGRSPFRQTYECSQQPERRKERKAGRR